MCVLQCVMYTCVMHVFMHACASVFVYVWVLYAHVVYVYVVCVHVCGVCVHVCVCIASVYVWILCVVSACMQYMYV